MNISNAKYVEDKKGNKVQVLCTIDGTGPCHVPMDADNTDYAEILKQVADGDITIAAAD